MISEEGLEKFRKLYEKKYKVKLSKKNAYADFLQLVKTVETLNSTKIDHHKKAW